MPPQSRTSLKIALAPRPLWAAALTLCLFIPGLHIAEGLGATPSAMQLVTTPPAVVFIIRHAEKPAERDNPDLTPTGFQRAAALPSLFLQQPGSSSLPRLPRPAALFASAPAKHSNRPIETITPLSQALHLRINADYADIETGPLAKEILSGRYAGKVVLVCWHHGEIPHLAQALGIADAPHRWDEGVFDQIWMIEWIDGKAQFTVLPEKLLPGDSVK
jgi:hypothetical protein